MLSPTLQFDVTRQQQQLLQAYQAQAASLKVTSEEFDGWLERVDQLSGVEVDGLTALHGQLIASGMLKFEISGRNVGLKYQLSQQGKKALEVEAVQQDETENFEQANLEVAADLDNSEDVAEVTSNSDDQIQQESADDSPADLLVAEAA